MAAGNAGREPGRWVLMAYRIPREPSTPRIAVWRKLERLGVARLGDGLVALPADARTREHLDWLAEEIIEVGGSATIWLAQPASGRAERELAAAMAADRAMEYAKVIDEARAGARLERAARTALLRRLRGELRRISRRDYFPPPERDHAHAAVEALTDTAPAQSEPVTRPMTEDSTEPADQDRADQDRQEQQP
ncbi:MAG: Chromate resistance protein ChrB [Actinomadura sp.]